MHKGKTDLTERVIPTLDSRFADVTEFIEAEIYMGEIHEEVSTPPPPPCFPGAWYRKVVSSRDRWLGIEGTVQLGEFIPDPARYGSDGRIIYKRYLDNPSIYMGGKAISESDAGLGLNIGYTSRDTSEPLNYGSPKIAYRPFWRYIYHDVIDENGNVLRRSFNSWNVADPRLLQYYYFPGDILRMRVISPLPNYLQLIIEVIEPTTDKRYVAIRKRYGLKNDRPQDFYSPIFYSKGHGIVPSEFKRVNSIDQYGNEGREVKPTKAEVTETTWFEVYLFRKVNGKIVKVPFNDKRQVAMACPDVKAFTITKTGLNPVLGGERICIHPGKADDHH